MSEFPGMKERDLAHLGPCAICHKPLLDIEKASLTFYIIYVQHCGFVPKNIQRQAGLGMILGNAALAQIMGPDEDFAKVISDKTVLIHEACAGELRHPAQLLED